MCVAYGVCVDEVLADCVIKRKLVLHDLKDFEA